MTSLVAARLGANRGRSVGVELLLGGAPCAGLSLGDVGTVCMQGHCCLWSVSGTTFGHGPGCTRSPGCPLLSCGGLFRRGNAGVAVPLGHLVDVREP